MFVLHAFVTFLPFLSGCIGALSRALPRRILELTLSLPAFWDAAAPGAIIFFWLWHQTYSHHLWTPTTPLFLNQFFRSVLQNKAKWFKCSLITYYEKIVSWFGHINVTWAGSVMGIVLWQAALGLSSSESSANFYGKYTDHKTGRRSHITVQGDVFFNIMVQDNCKYLRVYVHITHDCSTWPAS